MLSKEMTDNLPALPGVYFFKGRSGKILYIGKAKSLKKRVRSYLHNRKPKIKRLVNRVVELNYEICGSELEAFLLESRLIKKYRPSYDSLYKHTQSSPFIKVDLFELAKWRSSPIPIFVRAWNITLSAVGRHALNELVAMSTAR